MVRFTGMVLATLALALLASQAPAQAQADVARVIVRDSTGQPVPYALVQVRNGQSRTASDSGVADIKTTPRDSMRLIVRRLGYEPLERWVVRSDSGTYDVELSALPRSMKEVMVVAQSNRRLELAGFYDRMERARRGAYSARFFTPEEIDLRNPGRITTMLQGEPMVRLTGERHRLMLSGRGNCPLTILIDGRPAEGTLDEFFTRDSQNEIAMRTRQVGAHRAVDEWVSSRVSLDDLLTSIGVTAIELYGSMASAPAELVRAARSESCGLVAFWTGARR